LFPAQTLQGQPGHMLVEAEARGQRIVGESDLAQSVDRMTPAVDLLVDITQAGLGRGLEFTLFRPEKELPKDFYAEMPISVEVRGTYHELAHFVSDVAALPRIVTFGDITISASKDNKLTMSAKAKTYRYMEEGSVKKQEKAGSRTRKK